MTKNFIAITVSGAVYRVENGTVNYQGSQGSYSFGLANLRSIDRSVPGLTWADILKAEAVEVPVVGLSMYLDGHDEWRLSTEVASVTELSGSLSESSVVD